MKKQITIAILLGFVITTTNVCLGQDTTIESQKWIIGRWENASYGDILDVSQDSLRFLKNGLVFSKEDEEDWSWDYPKPESIDDLDEFFVNRGKIPFEFGYHFDSILGQETLSLAFNYEMSAYPFDIIKTYLYLNTDNNQLYYYFEDGTKVVLKKTSNLISEEQLLADLEEKEQQLSQDLALNGYGWLHGQWKQNIYGDIAVINIDSTSISYAKGFEEQGIIEIETTSQFTFELHNVIESNTIRLALIPDLVYVDKEQQSLYSFYVFDQRIDYTKVSDYTEQEQLAIAQKEEAERQAAYKKSQIIKYSIWAATGVVGVVLLLLLVRWIKKLMPKIKASAFKATNKAKEKAKVVSDKAKESKERLLDKSKDLAAKAKTLAQETGQQTELGNKVRETIVRLWQNKFVKIALCTALITIPILVIPTHEDEEPGAYSKTRGSSNSDTESESSYQNSYPNGDHTYDYYYYISIDTRQERAFGFDVYVTNDTEQVMDEVEISFYADGHTEKMRFYNLKPNKRENKFLGNLGDYAPEIEKVMIKWK